MLLYVGSRGARIRMQPIVFCVCVCVSVCVCVCVCLYINAGGAGGNVGPAALPSLLLAPAFVFGLYRVEPLLPQLPLVVVVASSFSKTHFPSLSARGRGRAASLLGGLLGWWVGWVRGVQGTPVCWGWRDSRCSLACCACRFNSRAAPPRAKSRGNAQIKENRESPRGHKGIE